MPNDRFGPVKTLPLHPSPPGPASVSICRDVGDDDLRQWLTGQALPLWSSNGVDWGGGGFFEQLDLAADPVEAPRRTRVVARQIYVFATAARRGWLTGADELVEHGLRFLLGRMRLADGRFASSVRPDGTLVDGRFDLYEQAFALFALATARADRPAREALRADAEALLRRLRADWRHPLAGFEENTPRSLPLRSNPHMHLLEAALAWLDVSSGTDRRVWDGLADELVDLCLDRLIDPGSGALHEQFDGDWRPMPGASGDIVEPGHQFEWAWLLMRAAARPGARPEALTAALRLLEIGETHGIDAARGVAVNALGRGMRVVDATAKTWPQTERIKAWQAAAALARGTDRAEAAARSLASAQRGLARFLSGAPAGLWREQQRADGSFVVETCRASSLYHIVCAIDTLQPSTTTMTPPPTPTPAPAGRSST